MAIEYRLTLAGTTTAEQVTARALPDPSERPTDGPPLFSADLYDRYGFFLTIRAGRNGYYDAEMDNDTWWEWEPAEYVNTTFRMEKTGDPDRALNNALWIVQNVLTSGSEDAAFAVNGNWLLLTRTSGTLVKYHRADWWDFHETANSIIPG
ncbi:MULTISPECIES: SitI3 family protein [Actinoplanes]|uniref:SitI3 family protein n=1 Tax=Actinoplanes TaxID=1865 RepID=UPI0005F2F94F|nr:MULTISPECIES: SitI3 family protein [Actinoplanes]GLY02143.1 hypothetical protein Acsp01_25220 [Actinoplanes sp. NBRC 101535]